MLRPLLAWLWLALSGCSTSVVSDANEVLYASDISLVEGPGRLLLPGRFHTLSSFQELVFARDADRDADELVVLNLDTGKSCRLAGAQRFERFRDGFLYQTDVDAQGRGTLRYSDAACRVQPFELPSASMPFGWSDTTESLYVHASGNVLVVDPVQNNRRIVLEDVSQPFFREWFLTGSGELIHFDLENARILRKLGSKVRTLATSLVGDLLFEDAHGIHWIPPVGEEVQTVTSDGCELGRYGDWLGYYSPCEARVAQAFLRRDEEVTLGTIRLDAAMLMIGVEFFYRDNVGSEDKRFLRAYYFRERAADADVGSLFYVDNELPSGGGITIGTSIDLRENVGESYPPHEFGVERWVSDHASISGLSRFARFGLALVDEREETETGKLVATTSQGPIELIDGAPNQSRLSPSLSYFFGDVRDGVGNLYQVCMACKPKVAYKTHDRVPLRGNFGFLAGTAVSAGNRFETVYYDQEPVLLKDFDGTTGNVVKMKNNSVLAQAVPAGGFSGLSFMQYGLAYLSDYDAQSQTGTLYYYNSKLDARGVIARNVSNFVAAGELPRAGVVYVQSEGPAPGLYMADAKR